MVLGAVNKLGSKTVGVRLSWSSVCIGDRHETRGVCLLLWPTLHRFQVQGESVTVKLCLFGWAIGQLGGVVGDSFIGVMTERQSEG